MATERTMTVNMTAMPNEKQRPKHVVARWVNLVLDCLGGPSSLFRRAEEEARAAASNGAGDLKASELKSPPSSAIPAPAPRSPR
jgi:hypothetical protein